MRPVLDGRYAFENLSGHAERFWTHVDRSSGPLSCWPWTKARMKKSQYGLFKVSGMMLHANRVAWALENAADPGSMVVMHSCDNPPCCNPAHLSIGTYADNAQDRNNKGRANTPVGERHGTRTKPEAFAWRENHPWKLHPELRMRGEHHANAKITEENVRDIRRRIAAGETGRSVAAIYGINKDYVFLVAKRKRWGHVK